MTKQELNKSLSRRILASIDQGSFDLMEAHAAPDFRMLPPGQPPMDLASTKAFMSMFMAAFPGFSHELTDIIAEGERVVRVGTFRGVHSGNFMGVPATGKQVAMDFVSVDTFRDDKVVSMRPSLDFMGLMQQIGAIPAPQAA